MSKGLNAGAGVNYDLLDLVKVLGQQLGTTTDNAAKRFGFSVWKPSRGESAFLVRRGKEYLSVVIEGLGTKEAVTRAVFKQFKMNLFASVARDTVAMIVNDMATVGTFPIVVMMHPAVGSAEYFRDDSCREALLTGWRDACVDAGCIYGPGETPELQGLIYPEAAVLSGAAVGISIGLKICSPDQVQARDLIYGIEALSVNANGLTNCREIAAKLPEGYATIVPGEGRSFGEVLLEPTPIICDVVEQMIRKGIKVRYGINITGHGWRKLMRAPQPLRYIIKEAPTERSIFHFIQRNSHLLEKQKGKELTWKQMYGGYNMGLTFALIIAPESEDLADEFCIEGDLPARLFKAGKVQAARKKQVITPWSDVTFSEDDLKIRK